MNDRPREWRTFSDIGELEYVCDLLREQGQADSVEPGVLSTILKRLEVQEAAQQEKIYVSVAGRCVETYLAARYRVVRALVESLRQNPCNVLERVRQLEVLLHKIYIFSLMTPDEFYRLEQSEKEKSEKVDVVELAWKNRANSKDKELFKAWAKTKKDAHWNVKEMRGSHDYPLEKELYTDDALKDWFKAAVPGFKFKTGRNASGASSKQSKKNK
ncbi:hypothetical protein [Lacisediminimonas profundi]|uniref:hypothetical protein n=1 Tax=Lacisediminimonas profundi TaxID=2603856 RepID=UPI00124B01CB|nr:hypothetical protein [Lacisediminimonas profundi]